jgi:hypothetical protein
MLRTASLLPHERAFDAGLRPRPFPDETASLLPGLLAATRTGLPPASDDELRTDDQPLRHGFTSVLLGAPRIEARTADTGDDKQASTHFSHDQKA